MSIVKDNRYLVKSKFIKTDVTTVEIVSNNYILAGIGNIVHIFDVSTLRCCYSQKVINDHRVHGIRLCNETDKVAFFGNRVVVIGTIKLNDKPSISIEVEWVVGDWVWDLCWTKNPSEVLVLTANNVVTLWNWKNQQNLRTSICQSKCLLYCGLILGDVWDNCIVICGTMFESIIVWAPSLSENGTCKIIHKLTGHQGAIFSVFFNEKLNRISSTSDDRSVKVWQVKFPNPSDNVVDNWKTAKINLSHTIYGHLSRVWKSYLLNDARLVTAGEDSQLRIWNDQGAAVYHWETHQGASIRCLCVDESSNMIVTGSKDGGISLWPLSANYSQQNLHNTEIKFKESFGIDCMQDVPRRLILSRSKKLLTVTNKGMVLIHHDDTWDCLVTDRRFASYCLFDVSPDRDCISMASICGTVILLKEFEDSTDIRVIYDGKICSSRIYSLHWLSNESFITCSEEGRLEIWELNLDSYTVSKLNEFILPPCKERWLTSAVLCDDYYVIGDRDGSVHCYSKTQTDQSLPLQTFRKIHGRLGVSYIYFNPDGELCSIGRDGFIRYWNVVEKGIEHVASDKLPVKWPTRVINSEPYGLLILGFNEVHFEIWNVTERKKLMMYKCGGGHRPWDFSIDEFLRFVYIKEKVICNVVIPLDQLVKPSCLEGFHIREVDCVRYLDKDLIISGSEDTTMRLSYLRNMVFTPISIIRSHLSSVRTISFVKYDNFYIVVSGGGRAQLKIWKIYKNKKGLMKYNELASHMLRSGSKCRKPWKNMIYTFELEPRHMDSKIRRIDDDNLVIYTAGSDAFWRIFSFSLTKKLLKLEKEVDYSSHCILRIIYLEWSASHVVLTMSTDGKVSFWDADTYTMFHQSNVHQNGINCCDYKILENHNLVLATGGDDTGVVITLFKKSKAGISVINQCRNEITHEAQVSGLGVVGEHIVTSGGDQKVVLWRWCIKNDRISMNLIAVYHSLIADIHGLDISSIEDDHIEVCVYGAGMEIVNINLPEKTESEV